MKKMKKIMKKIFLLFGLLLSLITVNAQTVTFGNNIIENENL